MYIVKVCTRANDVRPYVCMDVSCTVGAVSDRPHHAAISSRILYTVRIQKTGDHRSPLPFGREKTVTGLYIHVPFCVKKCPYCDFYSGQLSRKEEYIAAVLRELRRYDEMYDTVYFGGGTPSLLPEIAGAVLDSIVLSEGAEVTFECNPETVDSKVFETLKSAGVNRLSFGVQSLNDAELSALGRIHSADRARAAITEAASCGFSDISADLMLGIPHQTRQSLTETIDRLCALPLTHISAYMLKIEENTVFGKAPPPVPDEDEQAELYLLAVRELEKRGFIQYEISNFAKRRNTKTAVTTDDTNIVPISELYASRHNLKYWRCEEYIGIGPAAHSFYGGKRFALPRDLEGFLSAPQQQITDDAPRTEEERIMLGLRLSEGIPEELWKPLSAALKRVPKNYYRIENGRLSLTPEGFLLSNEIISLLLSENY